MTDSHESQQSGSAVAVREERLAKTFVELADSLVDDFDVVELLTLLADRSVEVLGASAAGILLASAAGVLGVMASSSEAIRILELLELQADQGPCLDCYRTGNQVINKVVADCVQLWPIFAPTCQQAGFLSVSALPLRLRGQTIGALNLFRTGSAEMADSDVAAGQALADVATIAILQQRRSVEMQSVNSDLNHALSSRILIEQAKGKFAERASVSIESAFEYLRQYARRHRLHLTEVARSVIDDSLDKDEILNG